MTELKLYEILNRVHGDEPFHKSHLIIEAMKQAVNETIQECADTVDKYGPYLNQNGGTKVITNLKVK